MYTVQCNNVMSLRSVHLATARCDVYWSPRDDVNLLYAVHILHCTSHLDLAQVCLDDGPDVLELNDCTSPTFLEAGH